MKFRLPVALPLFAALIALAASLPFVTTANSRRDFYFFDVELTSTAVGHTQLFFDMGRGINETDSSDQPLRANAKPVTYRYMLPTGTLQRLRLDPVDREASMTISRARIVDRSGRVVRAFRADELKPVQQFATQTIAGDALSLTTIPAAFDPIIDIPLGGPVPLKIAGRQILSVVAPVAATVFGVLMVLGWVAGLPAVQARLPRIWNWAQAHPHRAMLLTATAAVLLQCYPVIFFGKSFVSPDNAVYLLYGRFPTLPGYQSTTLEDAKGADVGAMMWQHSAYPADQGRALAGGELPLWNRYDLGGVPLLGQGQSMFGEPLNWLSILTSGAAWSWDLRFLLMRGLFALGSGLSVWLLVRNLGAALLVTFSSVFIGFFAFRYNHPAILSVCWAPWLLVAWCWLLEAAAPRARNLSLLALLAFHVCLMTSGTIKEAYMLIACMDLTGVLLIVLAGGDWRQRLGKLAWAAATGMVFVLVTAPLWMIFLGALAKSRTNYDVPAASQLPPWQALGFFEDLFYRRFRADDTHAEPSSNFVILLGVLWSLSGLRENLRSPRFRAVALGVLVPFALVFGLIPGAWLVQLPFIANIIHIDNTFSCSLIVLASVFAGFGLVSVLQQVREPRGLASQGMAALLAGFLVAIYFACSQQTPVSDFFRGYLPLLLLGLILGPAAAWLALRRRLPGLLAVVVVSTFALLLWRHGQYITTAFDAYVMNPKVRADFTAQSPAIEFVRSHQAEPARTVGLGYNLFPGYQQHLGLESIYGVDAVRNKYIDELAELTPLKKLTDWVGGPIAQEDIGPALPMHDLMNVRYYLATPQAGQVLPGRTPLAKLDLDVFESPTAWPRAFFTDTLSTYQAPRDFVAFTLANAQRPFASVQASDVDSLPAGVRTLPRNLAQRGSVAAHGYTLTANTTSFEVTASKPGIIVLTEAYYPGDFQVTLGNDPVPYFRVNHAFKGIYVGQPGTYHVTFRYQPERLTLALWLCFGGVMLGGAGLLTDWQWRRVRLGRQA